MDLAEIKMQSIKPTNNRKKKCIKCIVILLILIALIVYFIVDFNRVKKLFTDFIEWLRNSPVEGAFAFIGVYTISTVLFIPGTILTIGAGFAFTKSTKSTGYGILIGSVTVFVGAYLGAFLAMLIARFAFRELFSDYAKKRKLIKAIDKSIQTNGTKLILLLRLCPLIPFNLLNYLLGTTGVTIKDYLIGNFGMIPGTVVYVFIGSTINNVTEAASAGGFGSNPATLVLLIVGTLLALVAICYVSYRAKKELNGMLNIEKLEEEKGSKNEEIIPVNSDNELIIHNNLQNTNSET